MGGGGGQLGGEVGHDARVGSAYGQVTQQLTHPIDRLHALHQEGGLLDRHSEEEHLQEHVHTKGAHEY